VFGFFFSIRLSLERAESELRASLSLVLTFPFSSEAELGARGELGYGTMQPVVGSSMSLTMGIPVIRKS